MNRNMVKKPKKEEFFDDEDDDEFEEDEKETGLRKVLNFGHTIGHGFESVFSTFSPRRVAPIGSPPASPFAVETMSGVISKFIYA